MAIIASENTSGNSNVTAAAVSPPADPAAKKSDPAATAPVPEDDGWGNQPVDDPASPTDPPLPPDVTFGNILMEYDEAVALVTACETISAELAQRVKNAKGELADAISRVLSLRQEMQNLVLDLVIASETPRAK